MRSCDIEIYYRNYFNKMAITNLKKIVLICSHTWITSGACPGGGPKGPGPPP